MEPLMSANSAVTVLRSPSVAEEGSVSLAVTRIPGAPSTDARGCLAAISADSPIPQSPQNLDDRGFSAPQLGQSTAIALPQRAEFLTNRIFRPALRAAHNRPLPNGLRQ